MLTRLTPTAFLRSTTRGKTQPLILMCQKFNGEQVEVVAKFSAGCEQNVANLAREVIASCLASDLGLAVPEPFLIEVTEDWIAALPQQQRERVRRSSNIAFGCKLITGQVSTWNPGILPSEQLFQKIESIFFFDAMIQNMDRQGSNPNCLVHGDEIFIIDHEIAFTHHLMLFWKRPWEVDGLKALEAPGMHIFRELLRGREVNYGPIRDAWLALDDETIDGYADMIPEEWRQEATDDIQRAISLIKAVRDNIDDCVIEVQRVLT